MNQKHSFTDIATFIKEFKSKGDRKVFVIIGGYKYMLYEHFSDMAASDENRALFVKSVVKVMDLYELDGAAPFWVYPGCPNVGLKFYIEFNCELLSWASIKMEITLSTSWAFVWKFYYLCEI